MGIVMKPVSDIAAKFVRRAQAAGPDYQAGVQNPTKDWATEAAGAENNYNQGVQEAIGRSAFGKGVKEAGSGKWQEKAKTLGVQRYPTGVAQAGPDFIKGFAPIADALSRLVLPPRGPKGAPQNLQRVAAENAAAREASKR